MGHQLAIFLATGFGVGYAPKAPGTLGSLIGVPFAIASQIYCESITEKWITLLLCLLLGWYVTHVAEKALGQHDDQRIVIDEIVGIITTLIFFEFNWWTVLAGFLLFRLFDIWKPGPIGTIDSQWPGSLGTFFDDILAGVFAAFSLHYILKLGVSIL